MHGATLRRHFLRVLAMTGTGLVFGRWNGAHLVQAAQQEKTRASSHEDEDAKGEEVTAVEDLMREHGVLRRALLVYTAAAGKLRSDPATVAPEVLQKTAKLFRAFGEEYHEKKLEETHIFPAVKRAGGPAASLPDILITQHQRGWEITDYILAVTQGAKGGAGNAEPLAQALDSFVLMYRQHAAREDTNTLLVYVNDCFGDWSANAGKLTDHALAGRAPDAVEPIVPREDDPFVIKARHSIFYQTQVEYLLRQEGVGRITLIGQVTEQCVLYSALDGYVRHFEVAVAPEAVAHIREDLAEASLRMMETNMHAELVSASRSAV